MRWRALVLIFLLCGIIQAQQVFPRLQLKHYTQSDGLSNNYVNCIFQDHLDFIWLGTNDGLNRFDGVDFDVYRKKAKDSLSLSSNHIFSLTEDPYDRLWIGTINGLCWMDLKTRVVHRFSAPPISDKAIFSLCVLDERTLLAGSHELIYRISLHDMDCIAIQISEQPRPPNQPRANAIMVLKDQKVLSAGWDGIFEIDVEHGTSDHILKTSASILSIERYADSLIWVSAWGEGAFIFDPMSRLIKQKLQFGSPWEKYDSYAIVTDMISMDMPYGGRGLLVSGMHGIMIADPVAMQCRMIYNYQTGHRKLDTYDAFSKRILNAHNGIVWIASDFGFAKMDSKSQKLGEFAIESPNATPTHVADLHRDSEVSDSIWLALYAGGLVLYDLNKQEIVNSYKPSGVVPNRFDEYLIDCQRDGDRGFWVRNTRNDLYYFDRHTSSFSRFDNQQIRKDNSRTVLIHDKRIWNLMDRNLCLMDTGLHHCIQSYPFDSTMIAWLAQHRIQELLLDKSGNVWVIGHYGGCRLYDSKKGRFEPVTIRDADGKEHTDLEWPKLFEDSRGQIWLSHRYGLTLFRRSEFQPVSDHIPALISGLYLDEEDLFWIITGNQMVTFDSRTMRVQRYAEEDGLLTEDAITIGGVEGMNQIYIGYDGKFLLFDRDALGPRESDEPIRLTGFRVLDNDRTLLAETDGPVALRYQENDLRFDFRYLNFGGSKSTTYAFTLEGAEDTWNEAGNSNFAIYTNLRQGDYKFWVRATNTSGITTQPSMLAAFTIATPFWHSWWFRLSCFAGLAGVLLLLYSYRVNQLKSLMRMRTKISSDLHDEIGGGLTSIRVYSEMARKQNDHERVTRSLDKIEETAGDMVQSISDIVWAINPKYDSFTYTLQRMENFASSFLAMHEIQYLIIKDEHIESVKLSMQKRKNLLLIFKEAIVNATKHGDCTRILVRFDYHSGKLRMTVTDDGVGIDMHERGLENGFQSIHQHVTEIGGIMDVKSASGRGTQLEVEIPLATIL